MTYDAMAVAIDWLDAYRAGDIEAILYMYADDAVVECACGGLKIITGKEGLRAYWEQRLKDDPASDLDDLRPTDDGALISYFSRDGAVAATLEFDAEGRIKRLRCGPMTAQAPTASRPIDDNKREIARLEQEAATTDLIGQLAVDPAKRQQNRDRSKHAQGRADRLKDKNADNTHLPRLSPLSRKTENARPRRGWLVSEFFESRRHVSRERSLGCDVR